ncbi:MAG TPA: Fur family transcriptional regulator [Turneriella sp.]|nr:Fur family transcriptional regulator [Turneriella sp.]
MQSSADIAQMLKSRGLRVSLQKLEIAKHVLGTHRHFTAEEIFREINTDFPRVSRATVFNVLNLFAENGLLRTLRARSDVLLYDSNTSEHDHVVDTATGKVYDVELSPHERQDFLQSLWLKNPHLPKSNAASVVVHV